MPRDRIKTTRFELRLTDEAREIMDEIAKRDGSSRAQVVEKALRQLARREEMSLRMRQQDEAVEDGPPTDEDIIQVLKLAESLLKARDKAQGRDADASP